MPNYYSLIPETAPPTVRRSSFLFNPLYVFGESMTFHCIRSFSLSIGSMLLLGILSIASAEELQEIQFDELDPHWEQVSETWRPPMSMVEPILNGLEAGEKAEIVVTFHLDENGEAKDIKVIEASHDGLLEELLFARINQLRFQPGEENPEGNPVRVRMEDYFERY